MNILFFFVSNLVIGKHSVNKKKKENLSNKERKYFTWSINCEDVMMAGSGGLKFSTAGWCTSLDIDSNDHI